MTTKRRPATSRGQNMTKETQNEHKEVKQPLFLTVNGGGGTSKSVESH